MILQIIQLLLLTLGSTNNTHNAPRSLHRVEEPKPLNFQINPLSLIILMAVGMIVFVALILLFFPCLDSGMYYNNFDAMI